MERLLYSSSPSTMKFHSMRFHSLHRCGLIDQAKVLNYPSSLRLEFRPLNWISSQYVNSSPALSHSSPSNDFPSLSDSEYSAPRGSVPKSSFLKQIAIEDSGKRKVARTFIIFSALIMILIQPAFEAAAKTGNPVTATSVGRKLIQNELFSSAWTGFFAGCLHTLSGPDHLAALAPLSIGRTRMESVAVGALWGCGHDAGQLIFGLVFLLLKDQLHIEIIRTWGTRVVGATLLVIGALGFKEASESSSTPYETLEEPINGKKEKKKKNKIGFATFATGIVHGLQPDALMMVLPALALPSRVAGAAFLVMFLVGTVVAMGSYTVVIGSCSEALKDRVPRITEKLTWASSFVAIALGFAILTSQFFGYSLY